MSDKSNSKAQSEQPEEVSQDKSEEDTEIDSQEVYLDREGGADNVKWFKNWLM